ncbi:hypothetical protein BIY24_04505 [Halobacteriovorax marinus]|uniref:M14 family zinc carboxypeptidase n=1 Tax=Halobacteriovorax marinus TaxID=97084 RepID=UPI000BC34B4E|nr:succinylglutamate desuccinylase/aspartoacylase family protein [Halobacteriovorax marinus]ATH07221.1 hypothetical protein BIY24_04505 [Halobacteriovorax marinus]
MKKILLPLLFTLNSHSVCVHETTISGAQLLSQITHYQNSKAYYQLEDESFNELQSISLIEPQRNYLIQQLQAPITKDYNDRYIKYYKYERMVEFIKSQREQLEQLNYQTQVIGKSIEGRDLFAITPREIDPKKKLILMFARHHGDEGTANWIVEGFLSKALKDNHFNENFQLILYPMVNPDGANAKRRYNRNNRDLNRSWGKTPEKSYDEVKVIHKHLDSYLQDNKKPVIALDMHGSFTEDFIYRVSKSFNGQDFFETQQSFIDSLGKRDPWQAGQFYISNGHRKMSRILLVRDYGINSLTHESIRDIPLSESRTLKDLFLQGEAVLDSLKELY